MAAPNPKRYGLILPKKLEKPTLSKPSIFEDDSEDEHDRAAIERSIKKESLRNLKKMQTQLQLQKAMQEDPTVFEYDEVYDDLKKDKEEKKQEKTKDSKPRYIEQLLKAAENRKKESDRRMQRKIQKEREEEGEAFGEKDAYVTAAYRQKMQEMEEEEQEAARKQHLEDMMDVTKQKDLSGFYRHLLRQSVGEEKIPQNTDRQASPQRVIKEEPSAPLEDISSPGKQKHSLSSKEQHKASSSRRGSGESHSKATSSENLDENISKSHSHASSGHVPHKDIKGSKRDKRMYRTRKISDPPEDEEASTKVSQKSNENPDADSDFSVDSEDSSDEDAEVKLNSAVKEEEKKSENGPNEEAEKTPSADETKARENEWLQLFKKRTVGIVLDEARARYLERKAAMEAQQAAF